MKLFEMKHIKKSFDGLEVLKDISLDVEEGEVLSIIGPSGSGKYTILRLSLIHISPDESFLGAGISFCRKREHAYRGTCDAACLSFRL